MLRLLQRPLFCPCGRDTPAVAGRCRPCYFAEWRSRHFFGGLRERILARDQRRCRVCEATTGVCVHHRRAGKSKESDLIAVCRPCHARLHRRYQPPGWAPPLLITLWEEQHPGWPQQLNFPSTVEPALEQAA